MRPVQDAGGNDITGMIERAASEARLDPVHLLALLIAESGLNLRAERWGRETGGAQHAIATQDWDRLASIIARTWPDISFGGSQRIVLFHDFGDRTATVGNVLAVRDAVFEDPASDILAAAKRLAAAIAGTVDRTVLAGLVRYNSGSDNLHDPDWLARWSGNVASYERALAEAEAYREPPPAGVARGRAMLDVVWGVAGRLDALESPYAQQLRDAAVAIKEAAGWDDMMEGNL